MSQAGALNSTGGGGGSNVEKINVQTGTSPVVAASNTITFNGAVVAAGTHPVRTDGTGANTMALEVQTSQAIASTNASNIGLSAFNSANFTVDANGFVSFAFPQIETVNGDVGSATPDSRGFIIIKTGQQQGNPTEGSTFSFVGSGVGLVLHNTDSNFNTILGHNAGNVSITGTNNQGYGALALALLTSGSSNVSIGYSSLGNATSASNNIVLGQNSGLNLLTGSNNIFFGVNSGLNYTGAESSNILLSNEGVLGESNVTRIGTQGSGSGQQNVCYVAGIEGATYSAGSPTPALTYCDTSDGQLVSTQAVASSSATSTFGSLVVGTARQNTATHAILVNVSIVVTAATAATIVMGVGSTSTPSTNTVVASFSVAETVSFSAFVPAGYYMLVNTTGTITVGSITTQACAVG